jgi:plasmid replication initiation protein
MSKKNLVIQHNAIIEARYTLSVEEQRLIKTLVSKIQPGDEDFKSYSIRLIDLSRLLGISESGYYNRIKKVTKKIMSNILNITDAKGDDVQVAWLSSATYRRGMGTVELRFDPVLKPYLLKLKKCFTSYELENILRLKGIHSIRFYELLKQYEKIGSREFDLLELRSILNIDCEYQEYKYFKRSVLIPVQKEVSEKTDIKFNFSEKKIW